MGPAIDPLVVSDYSWWLEKAYEIFQEMVESGNQVAGFRLSELNQLEKTLEKVTQAQDTSAASDPVSRISSTIPQLLSPATNRVPVSVDQVSCNNHLLMTDNSLDAEYGPGPVLTTAEMAAMADSIEMYDAQWVSNALMTHGIW